MQQTGDCLEENSQPASYPRFDPHASYTEEDEKLDRRSDRQNNPEP
jgi:hypothetical protein